MFQERLCSFYLHKDPRRDLEDVFKEFQESSLAPLRSELQFFCLGKLTESTEVKMHFFTWEAWQSNKLLRSDQGNMATDHMSSHVIRELRRIIFQRVLAAKKSPRKMSH